MASSQPQQTKLLCKYCLISNPFGSTYPILKCDVCTCFFHDQCANMFATTSRTVDVPNLQEDLKAFGYGNYVVLTYCSFECRAKHYSLHHMFNCYTQDLRNMLTQATTEIAQLKQANNFLTQNINRLHNSYMDLADESQKSRKLLHADRQKRISHHLAVSGVYGPPTAFFEQLMQYLGVFYLTEFEDYYTKFIRNGPRGDEEVTVYILKKWEMVPNVQHARTIKGDLHVGRILNMPRNNPHYSDLVELWPMLTDELMAIFRRAKMLQRQGKIGLVQLALPYIKLTKYGYTAHINTEQELTAYAECEEVPHPNGVENPEDEGVIA